MLSRTLYTTTSRSVKLGPSGVRFASHLPIPPKVATPKSVQGPGGNSSRMDSVVSFYKSLPKGPANQRRGGMIKSRYFDGDNASGKPIVATIGALLLLGYTLEYQHLKHHKNYEH